MSEIREAVQKHCLFYFMFQSMLISYCLLICLIFHIYYIDYLTIINVKMTIIIDKDKDIIYNFN